MRTAYFRSAEPINCLAFYIPFLLFLDLPCTIYGITTLYNDPTQSSNIAINFNPGTVTTAGNAGLEIGIGADEFSFSASGGNSGGNAGTINIATSNQLAEKWMHFCIENFARWDSSSLSNLTLIAIFQTN